MLEGERGVNCTEDVLSLNLDRLCPSLLQVNPFPVEWLARHGQTSNKVGVPCDMAGQH